ncbi:MAG: Uma2 family endonuclease [Verrucomicrobiales bacterium]
MVIEVLLDSTCRTDQNEKKDAYLTIPSLAVYVMLEQEPFAAVAYRRSTAGFERELYEGRDAIIPLAEIEGDLSLAEAYEGLG